MLIPQMKPGVFREEYIAIIVRELLRGLEYLHNEGKLHRDIKGSYIAMIYVLVVDLGYSCQHIAVRRRRGQASRLRRFWSIIWDVIRKEEYICRKSLLDVAGGHKAKRIRP